MNSHRENPSNLSDRDDAVTNVRMISSEPFFRGERFRRFRHVDTGPFVPESRTAPAVRPTDHEVAAPLTVRISIFARSSALSFGPGRCCEVLRALDRIRSSPWSAYCL